MDKQEIVGIDRNMGTDFLIGLIVGVAILIIGGIIPGIGAISVPTLPQSLSSDVTKIIVVVILASLFETFAFFDIVLSFFHNKLGRFGLKLPFIVAVILTSVVFAGFHYSAYGNFSSSSGSFASAFIMGLVFCYERKFTNSNLPGILTHMVLNYWIAFGSLSIVLG